MFLPKDYLQNKIYDLFRDVSSLANPFILISILLIYPQLHSKALTIILGLISIEFVCQLIKLIYDKPRPIIESYSNFIEKINARSFPSIHSARITFFFLNIIFIQSNLLITLTSITLIILVSLSRIISKKHYIIDVLVGNAFGILFFFLYS